MRLGQRDKELAAIGAASAAIAGPASSTIFRRVERPGCPKLTSWTRSRSPEQFVTTRLSCSRRRIDELVGGGSVPGGPVLVVETSRARTLVALGASVGANSHQLLERHIAGAPELGLGPREITAAVKMAGYVQNRASEMTACGDARVRRVGRRRRRRGPELIEEDLDSKGADMARKSMDCRDHPDATGCTLYLSGEEDELLRAVAEHAASVHGMEDTPELRELFRSMLKDEVASTRA